MVYLYSRYLNEICHCYADDNGNRPCYNVTFCDSCDQQEISIDDWRREQMFGTKKD